VARALSQTPEDGNVVPEAQDAHREPSLAQGLHGSFNLGCLSRAVNP
jgi:hypothetical protein